MHWGERRREGSAASYGYDGDGMKSRQTSGGNAIFHVRSSVLGNVAMEVNAAAGVYRAYVYAGGKLVAQRSYDGQFYWMHQDHLGSGRKRTDETGAVKYRAEFDPYGQLVLSWSASGYDNLNSKRFTGYERDTAAGLDYANARMYSASGAGRFMQADPIGLKAANKNNPMSLNLYTYVNNDPINGIDPTGTLLAAPEENNDPGLCGTGILSNHSAWYQSRGGEYGGFLIVIAFGGMTLCNLGGGGSIGGGNGGDDLLTRPRSSCGRLVDSILHEAIFPSLLGTGRGLLSLAHEYATNGLGKDNPIDGFQGNFVAGGQRGEVYQHVLAHASAWYIGTNCILPLCIKYGFPGLFNGETASTGAELSNKALARDIYQRDNPTTGHSAEEAQAEIDDDLAGRWIAGQIHNLSVADYANRRDLIANRLCVNGGYAK